MDIDIRDKRNRFQINRVDSNLHAQGGGQNNAGTEGTFNGATLVGYTSSEGNKNSPSKLQSL